jgi:hypothetical protein
LHQNRLTEDADQLRFSITSRASHSSGRDGVILVAVSLMKGVPKRSSIRGQEAAEAELVGVETREPSTGSRPIFPWLLLLLAVSGCAALIYEIRGRTHGVAPGFQATFRQNLFHVPIRQ